jgi:hypothetical protein
MSLRHESAGRAPATVCWPLRSTSDTLSTTWYGSNGSDVRTHATPCHLVVWLPDFKLLAFGFQLSDFGYQLSALAFSALSFEL